MIIYTPVHQFEIRYSNILNFPIVIRDTIAPFVKFANSLSIEHENSHKERIILDYDEQNFQISVSWDRIIIRIEAVDFNSLTSNNSIIEEPFFNLFKKISDLNGFGEIKNFLFFSVTVNPINDSVENVIDKFSQKYLNKKGMSLFSSYSDVGLSFEKNHGETQTFLNIGPYVGIKDLKKMNLEIKNAELNSKLECIGEVFEYKYFETNKSISFRKYKEIFTLQTQYIDSLWE